MVDFSDDAEIKPSPNSTSMSEASSTSYICLHPISPLPLGDWVVDPGFQGGEKDERRGE